MRLHRMARIVLAYCCAARFTLLVSDAALPGGSRFAQSSRHVLRTLTLVFVSERHSSARLYWRAQCIYNHLTIIPIVSLRYVCLSARLRVIVC
jgi:hypothetical protein